MRPLPSITIMLICFVATTLPAAAEAGRDGNAGAAAAPAVPELPQPVRRSAAERLEDAAVTDVQRRSFSDGLAIYRFHYRRGDEDRVLLLGPDGAVLLDEARATAEASDEAEQAQTRPEADDRWQGLRERRRERQERRASTTDQLAREQLPEPVLRTFRREVGDIDDPFMINPVRDSGRTIYRITYRAREAEDGEQGAEGSIRSINIDEFGRVVDNPLRERAQEPAMQELELPDTVWSSFVDEVGVAANILSAVRLRTRNDGMVYHLTYLDDEGWMHSVDFREDGELLDPTDARRIWNEEQLDKSPSGASGAPAIPAD